MTRDGHGDPIPIPCHWVRTAGDEEIMIPGCYGTVVAGPHACTCDVPPSRIERAQALIREMHTHHDRLRERLTTLRVDLNDALAELRAATTERDALRRRLGMIESAHVGSPPTRPTVGGGGKKP